MNWKPKSTGLIITALICSAYFNLLFCEQYNKSNKGGPKISQQLQVLDLTLTPKNNSNGQDIKQSKNKTQIQVRKQGINPANKSLRSNIDVDQKKTKIKQEKVAQKLSRSKIEELLPVRVTTINKVKQKIEPSTSIQNEKSRLQQFNSNIAKINEQSHKNSRVKAETPALNGDDTISAESVMQKYMTQVRDFISKHKRYPQEAKIRKHQGKVTISFVINADGRVNKPQIIKGCNSRYINKSTKVLLSKLRFKVAPVEIKSQFPKTVILEVSYQFG